MSDTREPNPRLPILFLCIAFSWAWVFWAIPLVSAQGWIVVPRSDELFFPLVVLGAFGPLAAAVTVNGRQGTTRRFFSRALRWRIPLMVLLTAIFLTPAAAGLATWIYTLQGGTAPAISIGWKDVLLLSVILFFVGGPCNEEFGWAFAIDRLQPRFGFLRASLLLEATWACWHAPLFFISTMSQAHMPFWAFLVTCCALRVAMVWGYNRSNQSILLPLLFHTSLNLTQNIFPVLVPDAARDHQPLFLLYTALLTIAAALLASLGNRRERALSASATTA